MTKAELLKLLEPFPDDALIVAGTGYDWMDGWEDVESIRLIEIALTPDDIGGVKYIEPGEYGEGELPADLERLPAIPFAARTAHFICEMGERLDSAAKVEHPQFRSNVQQV